MRSYQQPSAKRKRKEVAHHICAVLRLRAMVMGGERKGYIRRGSTGAFQEFYDVQVSRRGYTRYNAD